MNFPAGNHPTLRRDAQSGRIHRILREMSFGKQIAALVGLAPINCDINKKRGYRKTGKGRLVVRSVLYMTTLSGIRYKPAIIKQYQHLISRGKEKKVALVACMRKLLTILNAMMWASSLFDTQLWLDLTIPLMKATALTIKTIAARFIGRRFVRLLFPNYFQILASIPIFPFFANNSNLRIHI